MKQQYRIFVIGPLPLDLKERIATVHAAGILKAKSDDGSVDIQVTKGKNGCANADIRQFDSIHK